LHLSGWGCGRNDASMMHLNGRPDAVNILSVETQRSEIVMSQSERAASGSFPAVANAEAEATKLNQSALEFMLGAQKMMFEELVFFGDEMLERTRTETHLFSEFVAKMASAHSVRDIRTMYQECGQHQLDFFRRDTERLFRHGERMIAATSNLISGRAPN
jgi:hypothetical protein